MDSIGLQLERQLDELERDQDELDDSYDYMVRVNTLESFVDPAIEIGHQEPLEHQSFINKAKIDVFEQYETAGVIFIWLVTTAFCVLAYRSIIKSITGIQTGHKRPHKKEKIIETNIKFPASPV